MKLKEIMKKFIQIIIKSFSFNDNNISDDETYNCEIRKVYVSESIFKDKKLKANEKLYLIVLINAYDYSLGYAEISNKDIMSYVSCSNPNTVSAIMDRLERNEYIKNVQEKYGKIGRYKILKHIQFSQISNCKDSIIFLDKTVSNIDREEFVESDNTQIAINDNISNNIVDDKREATNLINKIQNEFRTSSEALSRILHRASKLDKEISEYLNIKDKN